MAATGIGSELRRWLGQLGSLRLAVVVLGLLAVVLAGGTIYESVYGTPAAQRDIYDAWWFNLLLLVLAVNVAAATASRWPWRARHVGFVLTHAAILLILGGCLTTRWAGANGKMVIVEGQQSNRVILDDWELAILRGQDVQGPLAAMPVSQPPRLSSTEHFGIGEQSYQVRIVQYLVDAQARLQIVDGSEGDPAGVRVELQTDQQRVSQWLLVDDASGQWSIRSPGFQLAAVNRFEHPAKTGGVNLAIVPEQGKLVLYESNSQGLVQQVELSQDVPIAIGSARVSLRVREFRPHVRTATVVEPVRQPSDQLQPAIEVELVGPQAQHRGWLAWGQPAGLQVGPRNMRLVFRSKDLTLPFAIQLNRFDLEMYPATDRARMYRSNVTVLDESRGQERTVNIEMNRPLKYGGWAFVQNGYSVEGNQRLTILAASRDPGRPIVYAGAVLLIAGIVAFVGQRLAAMWKMRHSDGVPVDRIRQKALVS